MTSVDPGAILAARALPILDVARQLGAQLKRSGQEWAGPCPRCGGTDRFAINPAKRIFVCRGGGGGDVIEMHQHVAGVGFVEAVERLVGPGGAGVPRMGVVDAPPSPQTTSDLGRIALAQRVWSETVPLSVTLAYDYLRIRLVEAYGVEDLRFHASCAYRDADGRLARAPAMIAAMRDIRTNEIRAVQRTLLRPDGTKFDRRMLGPSRGCAIKLDADEDVHAGLVVGEGTETCLAARMLGYRPTWALGSTGAIAGFEPLPGIEALTILAEAGEASARAVEACGRRWHEAGREVRIVRPRAGSDVNDSLQELAT